MHRGRLQLELLAAVRERLGPDAVRTGHRLVAVEHGPAGPAARFATGGGEVRVAAELVVGADGIHSALRRQQYPGERPPVWNGLTLWRGTAPVYMITGWYDIFLPWPLRNYATLVEAGRPPRLTIGPWGHVSAGMGAPSIAETTDFLKEHLAGGPAARGAPVRAFLTGTGADEWHALPAWPPPDTVVRPWHLHAAGRLDPARPDGGVTRYTYDPADPTPAVGGPSLLPGSGPVDNTAHERRADVVVFRGEPLATALVLAGEPVARIRFRSSRPSADIFVRICDVHPDGRSMTVCDGIRRIGGVGTAATDPAPDDEGFGEVEVRLWPAFHRFAPGHRIGVQVSSGAHPRYARNPGSGEPAAVAATLHPAEQEVSHDTARPSRLDLPVRTP